MPKALEAAVAKLRLKVGPHEFEAEGPREVVAAHFAAWKQLIAAGPHDQPAAESPTSSPPAAGDVRDLFVTDKWRHLITLRVSPTGEAPLADAALLILYGYPQCLGLDGHEMPVTRLKEALAASGHRRLRIDRTLAAYVADRLLTKTGHRKGTAYALTPAGLERAEKLARALRLTLPSS
ncbi:MAG TPA: hypothetical protein VMW56_17925 [Candidatus Margulisiibacteriota bacterium]|nr:hypothetical protein [Candidatus Margulisiibacteriota bacterium]